MELFEKRADRAMILVSHAEESIRAHCNKAAVLCDGMLHHFESVDAAFTFYKASGPAAP